MHLTPAAMPRETNLPGRLRILFLTPFPPSLAGTHGGARSTASIIMAMTARHDVGLVYLHQDDVSPADEAIAARCVFAEGVRVPAPAAPRGLERLSFLWGDPEWARRTLCRPMLDRVADAARAWRPDVAHFEFHVMGQYLAAITEAAPAALRILVEHEPGIVAARDHGNSGASMKRRLAAIGRRWGWARFERRVMAGMDAIVTFTDKDRAALTALGVPRGASIFCIPLRIALPDPSPAPRTTEADDLLFIGNFDHPPNIDAAERLAMHIYPRVKAAVPGATLSIVGPNPTPKLRALDGNGICVTGWVPDVAPHIERAAMIVAPLRQGGGMRVKVIEALAAAKAVVASPVAVEGLSLQHGTHYLHAVSDEDFAAAAVALLNDHEQRRRIGNAGREWAQRTQDLSGWAADYEALYARLGLAVDQAGPLARTPAGDRA